MNYKNELKSRESDFGRTSRHYIRCNADKERATKNLAEVRSLIETQKSSIKMLQDELGEECAMFDGSAPCQYEARMVQVQEDMQKEIDKEVELLRRSMKKCDAQRGAITMFDEKKRYESHIQRLQSDVHRANTAMDKMRDEAVHLWSKNNDLRDERSRMKQQQEDDDTAGQMVLADRDSTIENLQSLLEIRNQELDVLERSVGGPVSNFIRTR